MKKLNFLSLFLFLSLLQFNSLQAQLTLPKATIASGGVFGNTANNAHLQIFDPSSLLTRTIDTVQTQSVQDLVIDSIYAYVAAQDSIVKYDLRTENRVAAAAFPGISTRAISIYQNELWVGNWYGQNSDNLYVFDKDNLNLIDTIQDLSNGAKSIVFLNNHAYISQNTNNAGTNFQDSLGYIVEVDLQSHQITDTLNIPNYSGQLLELVPRTDSNIFYAINSNSNSIGVFDLDQQNFYLRSYNQSIECGNSAQYSLFRDTLFLNMNGGIGAINMKDLNVIDPLIVDTLITAFTYDTISRNFHITQTNFGSLNQGGVYDRAGVKQYNFSVGSSPEVIRMWYDGLVGLTEKQPMVELEFNFYPNPAQELIQIDLEEDKTARVTLFDQSGKVLIETSIDRYKKVVELNFLPAGHYFLSVQQQDKRRVKSLIKR